MTIPNEWDEMLKKAEKACGPYLLYADMFRAGIRTAEKLGVGSPVVLKAVSEVVLPEMRNNLKRMKDRLEYSSFINTHEVSGMIRLQECITEVEKLA